MLSPRFTRSTFGGPIEVPWTRRDLLARLATEAGGSVNGLLGMTLTLGYLRFIGGWFIILDKPTYIYIHALIGNYYKPSRTSRITDTYLRIRTSWDGKRLYMFND